jgi:hypothetical protein
MNAYGGMRSLTNAPKHPRYVRELMEGEVMILITGDQALDRLTLDCKFPEEKARRLLNIAWEFGQKAEPCPGGYVHIWYHGQDDSKNHVFSVVEHIGPSVKPPTGKVARKADSRYTQGTNPETRKVGTEMPPRRNARRAAPEPEPEAPANGEVDYQKYVDKPFSPTMTDYIEWFEQNVASLDELDVERILVLGVSMYSHFQKSDFNIERREERRSQRATSRAAAEDEPEEAEEAEEEAPRTRRGKAPAKPAPAASARSGARSSRRGNGSKPATAQKPARQSRRAAATAGAAAGGDAPF